MVVLFTAHPGQSSKPCQGIKGGKQKVVPTGKGDGLIRHFETVLELMKRTSPIHPCWYPYFLPFCYNAASMSLPSSSHSDL